MKGTETTETQEQTPETSSSYEATTLTTFKSWHELMDREKFSDEQYGKVYRAFNNYCYYDIETELPSPEKFIFEMAKTFIKAHNDKKSMLHNGCKRGVHS